MHSLLAATRRVQGRPGRLLAQTWNWQHGVLLTSFRRHASSEVSMPLFDKILIANRGEIACRVMRTARRLGIKTVAVYSEADKDALHVKMADEAYHIGPASSSKSYLRIDKIIRVAKDSGAQAIHPGYGFLSENPTFAKRLAEENITFIGPPASAIISMGSKSESKDIMLGANVPCVPGYHGTNQDPTFLKEKAAEIGYPVLIKAVKGGGGKGMRIAHKADEFDQMLESAKRESRNSFGDEQVLVEKYLVEPRHVEVQVFADTLGNVVHLFERDCSVQRRHQKIIEEAPAPGLSDDLRAELGAKAVAAAKAVNYVGAGTVEFIMDNLDQKFYFMEMNTRLQVEHPVTEMVTGTDLVQWQLEVAAGNPLPVTLQENLELNGHAFEARIYAENPSGGFLPDTGFLLHVRTPEPSQSVRVETGFGQGDLISIHYDPMIAKLVVRGNDRTAALRVLRRALEQYQIVGLHTNIDFIKSLASHPAFIRGEVETGFIPKFEKELFAPIPHTPNEVLAQAAIALTLLDFQSSMTDIRAMSSSSALPKSPWSSLIATRPGGTRPLKIVKLQPDTSSLTSTIKVYFNVDGSFDVQVHEPEEVTPDNIKSITKETKIIETFQGIKVTSDSHDSTSLHFQMPYGYAKTTAVSTSLQIYSNPAEPLKLTLFDSKGNRHLLNVPAPGWVLEQKGATTGSSGSVKAPMPCRVTSVSVRAGDQVSEGQPLVVVEAMKMEMVIKAPRKGTVARVLYGVGDLVKEGQDLVAFEIDA